MDLALDKICRLIRGGGGRNRTGVHGFAGRCMTTLPPRRVDRALDKTARRHKLRGRALALPRDSGAGKESRTPDLNLGKVALYQLSYSRVGQLEIIAQRNVVSKREASHVVEIHGLDVRYRVIALVANSLRDSVFASAECIRVIAFSRLAIEVANEIRT